MCQCQYLKHVYDIDFWFKMNKLKTSRSLTDLLISKFQFKLDDL